MIESKHTPACLTLNISEVKVLEEVKTAETICFLVKTRKEFEAEHKASKTFKVMEPWTNLDRIGDDD